MTALALAEKHYDVAILGAGPGGYPAAIKAAQQGLSVALIEADLLGGTCLNWGCIPTKSLITSAESVHSAKKAALQGFLQGIDPHFLTPHFLPMKERMDLAVGNIRQSLKRLLESNGIHLIFGYGRFIAPKKIKVSGDEPQLIHADKVIIATGSKPRNIAAFPFDHERILSSDSILGLKELPKKLIIIGGGVIGCEFASLYHMLGVEVVILEAMERLIPMECETVGAALAAAFKERGIAHHLKVSVAAIDKDEAGITVKLASGEEIRGDLALVAVGRQLNTSDIGLDKAGVFVDERGVIAVNAHMQTNVAGIYAIGDITAKAMLAHVATHQGVVAADHIAGKSSCMHYNAIPSVIFTYPEIATVGKSLAQAQKEGESAQISAFPFQALGKSQASFHTDGFAQVVTCKKSGAILGAQVVGHSAATLIAEMALAIANELTLECITETIHAHPTEAEGWMEAAFIAQGMPLHLPPKKKKEMKQNETEPKEIHLAKSW